MSNDHNYTDILLEQIRDQNKAILEAVGSMQQHVATIPDIQRDITELKSDTVIIKTAVKDTNRDLQLHDQRITSLENAA